MAIARLDWVLATYVNDDPRPTAVPAPATARASLAALGRRARFEAALLGVRDPDVADEAVSAMLAALAESRVEKNFRPERGSPRRYINAILRRTVLKVLHQRRGAARPLPEEVTAREPGPAALAEVRDLGETCGALLRDMPAAGVGPGPGATAAARYLRRHRARKAVWAKVSHLFPDVALRPRRRRVK